jgi:acetolactate synthase-1/2/3 large subunit
MTVSDYIMSRLVREGINTVFFVPGGGNMYLVDALQNCKALQGVSTHHEQAAAMAAVGKAKATRQLEVCLVTTGCGGTNALTGLLHAWQDGVPCIFISGQVAVQDTIRYANPDTRQVGMQEADIISMVRPITKYAKMITSVHDVESVVDEAISAATTGRLGPVWIDVPLDIQKADFPYEAPTSVLDLLRHAERPVIIAGHGVWLAKAETLLQDFALRNNIPVVYSRLGVNALPYTHPLHIGEIGIKGTRAANLAVQNADLLLVLGSRLSKQSIGYKRELFARDAKKVIVDIDVYEHRLWEDYIFERSDVYQWLTKHPHTYTQDIVKVWKNQCQSWRQRYPVMQSQYSQWDDGVNMYHFIDEVSDAMPENSVVISDAGSAVFAVSQGLKLKEGQIYVTSGAQAEMGFTLPAAIGIATIPDKTVVAITGDGSLQMNIQELETMKRNNYPIKLFVLNNNGYLSIRTTQENTFKGNYIGVGPDSGLSFPDLQKLAFAYDLPYKRLASASTLVSDLQEIFLVQGPMVCEVMCGGNQEIAPTVGAGVGIDGVSRLRPMEDMLPFLSREEYRANLFVDPIE